MRRLRRIRTDPWFPFDHEANHLNLSRNNIFRLEQLNREELSTDHCFMNCLKYFNIDPDAINFARDIIRDLFPLKHLNKVCSALEIVYNTSYVDETGKQHSPKQYEVTRKIVQPKIYRILMFEHYMPSGTVDKSIIILTNRIIKLSTLISTLLKSGCSLDLIRTIARQMITVISR
jgi:hypothetical protein